MKFGDFFFDVVVEIEIVLCDWPGCMDRAFRYIRLRRDKQPFGVGDSMGIPICSKVTNPSHNTLKAD